MLGDALEKALSLTGITQERVEYWLGRPCGCEQRKEKLNRLGNWAWRILAGKKDNAEKYLQQIMDD